MKADHGIRIECAPYGAIREELLAFRNAHRAQKRDLAYFDWRYLGRPSGEEPIIVRSVDRSGATVGAISLIPHHFSVSGATRLFGVLGDISVAPAYRGRGLAVEMFKYLARQERVRGCLSAGLVMPNEAAAGPLERAGWRRFASIRRHVAPLPAAAGASGSGGACLGSNGFARSIAEEALARLPFRNPRRAETLETKLVEGFDERFDDLWGEVRRNCPVLAFRNRKYLTWRYADRPDEKYLVFTLSEGARLWGYVVFFQDGVRCQVMDLLCRQGGQGLERCLRAFLEFVQTKRAVRMAVVSLQPSLLSLRMRYRLGLLRRSSRQSCMAWIVPDSAPGGHLGAGAGWYLTPGDKDS